jgi:DNA-binding SARP family transcriptional activator/predicted ATPase
VAALKISVLGPLKITKGDKLLSQFASNKVRALLAYLVVEIHCPHSRESLAELLWPGAPSQSAFGNLRYVLANLRHVLDDASANPPYLLISRESLQFNALSSYELDTNCFINLLQTDNIEKLKQACTLYQGDFLAGFPSINSNPFEEWVYLKREQFRRRAIEALRVMIDQYKQHCEYKQAIPFAYRQLELEPWLEEAHQQLMRLLALEGQRSAALAQFQTCRRILSDELGVEPSAETIHLYESIRDGGLGTPQNTSPLEFDPAMRSLIIAGQNNADKTGVTFRLIEDLLESGRKAVDHSSYEQAVANYRHGLDLLRSLPDSPAKLEQELELQTALGAALLPIRIWSHPEVARAYQRAYQLCQQLGNRSEFFHVLKALVSYYTMCGDIFVGLEIGQWLLEAAEEKQDDALLVIAYNNRGITLLFAGEFNAYRQYADKVLALYDENRHRHLTSVMGYDPKVGILSQSIGLWALGYPDQALARVRQAVAWADEIRHPFSQCYARFLLAYIHLLRREVPCVLENAETLILFANQQRNSFWFAEGLVVKGWALANLDQAEEGLQLLLQGLSIIHGTGSMFVVRASSPWLAEVSGMAGKAGEGLSTLDEYISQCKQSGILQVLSSQYICRAGLCLRLGRPREAEADLETAIEVAQKQEAKGWELRARLHLARLWTNEGRFETAYQCLKSILGWFTEGLDTLDFNEAKALLEKLG